MAYVQANTNGRLHPAAEASVSPLDRGFLYGDAIYEVWRTYHGCLFAWDEHLERLATSAAALEIVLPWTPAELLKEIVRTVAAYREAAGSAHDYYVRLQLTRGGGMIGLDPALAEGPCTVILVQALARLAEDRLERGMRLTTARRLRRNPPETLNPAWKTGNYLNNLLCLSEARKAGADEVLMLNLGGELTEAAVSNVCFVSGGEVVTPPAAAGILHGVTRRLLLGPLSTGPGWRIREGTVRPSDLAGFEECFLCSTTKDVVPVGEVDDVRYRTGPETVTRRLKASFAEYAAAYAASRPELTVV